MARKGFERKPHGKAVFVQLPPSRPPGFVPVSHAIVVVSVET